MTFTSSTLPLEIMAKLLLTGANTTDNGTNGTILPGLTSLRTTTEEPLFSEMLEPHISPITGLVTSVCVLTLSLLIICGNALVIHTVRVEKSLHTVGNCFIVSLAISDLLVGLFALPFNVFTYLPVSPVSLGIGVGYVWITVDYLLSSVTILNQVMLNLDRFWSITSPIRYMRKRTKRRAFFQVLSIWIFAIIWVMIPAVGWHAFFPNVSPSPRTHYVQFKESAWLMATSAIVIFFIPLFIMFGIYIRIFVEINRRSKLAVGRCSVGSVMSRRNSGLPGLTAQELDRLRAIYRNSRGHDDDSKHMNGHLRYNNNLKIVRHCSSINEETTEELCAAEKQGFALLAANEDANANETIAELAEKDKVVPQIVRTEKISCLEDKIDRYKIANRLLKQQLDHIPNSQIFNETSSQDGDGGLEMRPILHKRGCTSETDDRIDEGVGDDDDMCEGDDEGGDIVNDDEVFVDDPDHDVTDYFKPVKRQCPQRTYVRVPVHDYCVWMPRIPNGFLSNDSAPPDIPEDAVIDSAPRGDEAKTFPRNSKSETNLLEMKKSDRMSNGVLVISSGVSKNSSLQASQRRHRCYSHPKVLGEPLERRSSMASILQSKLRSVNFSRLSISSSFSGSGGRGSTARLQLSQQAKAAKQLGIIMACFLLCWLPYFVQVVVISVCPEWYNLALLQVGVYLGYLNSLCNTFLYAMCNAKFRKSLKNKLLSRCCQENKSKTHLPTTVL